MRRGCLVRSTIPFRLVLADATVCAGQSERKNMFRLQLHVGMTLCLIAFGTLVVLRGPAFDEANPAVPEPVIKPKSFIMDTQLMAPELSSVAEVHDDAADEQANLRPIYLSSQGRSIGWVAGNPDVMRRQYHEGVERLLAAAEDQEPQTVRMMKSDNASSRRSIVDYSANRRRAGRISEARSAIRAGDSRANARSRQPDWLRSVSDERDQLARQRERERRNSR